MIEMPYRDAQKLYQRVLAGIGWPGSKPGAVVVIGEETGFKAPYQHYLLAEREEADPAELFRICADLERASSRSAAFTLDWMSPVLNTSANGTESGAKATYQLWMY